MVINLKIVRVNPEYCDYLRKYDNKISYNKNEKERRPFIGILFEIDTCKYFAPLASLFNYTNYIMLGNYQRT